MQMDFPLSFISRSFLSAVVEEVEDTQTSESRPVPVFQITKSPNYEITKFASEYRFTELVQSSIVALPSSGGEGGATFRLDLSYRPQVFSTSNDILAVKSDYPLLSGQSYFFLTPV
jgi:hypothetical protein